MNGVCIQRSRQSQRRECNGDRCAGREKNRFLLLSPKCEQQACQNLGILFCTFCWFVRLFLFLGEESLLEVLPQDTEQYTLHTVGEDLCFETTEQKAADTRLRNNILNNLGVGDLFWIGLFVDLAYPNGIGTGVTDSRGAEPEDSPSSEFGKLVVLLGNSGTQIVVRKKPGVVAHEGRRGGRKGSVIEGTGSGLFDLVGDGRKFSRHLHRRLLHRNEIVKYGLEIFAMRRTCFGYI